MQVRQMPDDGMNIGHGRGSSADSSTTPAHTDHDGLTVHTNHDSSTSPVSHNGMQRRVLVERGTVGGATGYPSPAQARRPLRTVPLVPLESASGTSTRKESAQAVWNYISDIDEIMPAAPAAPASASELDEAINDDSFIQPQTLPMQSLLNERRLQRSQNYPNTGEYMQRRSQGYLNTGEHMQRGPQSYPNIDEQEVRQIPARRRRLVRTSSLAQNAEPTAIALPLPTTAPLSGPYDRLLPSWQLQRKRDTIFLVLLTLLVLSILGILTCNYLLSMYNL